MADLKTTKEERAEMRMRLALKRGNSLLARALDDLDTLEAECADLRAQNRAMMEVLADLRRLNEAEVERLRGVLQEVDDARVTEHGLELSRDLLSRIWAMTNEEPTP